MPKKMKPSRMTQALLETTRDFHRGGLVTRAELDKVTMRALGENDLPKIPNWTGPQIKRVRERTHVSQAVLASYLGITVGYLSRLERGEVTPSRPVARLLDIVARKGLDAFA